MRALAARGFIGPFCAADGRMIHAAGGTDAQELAFALAQALAALRALEAGGLALDDARRAIGFRIAVDADQFASICKLRALRRLWARVEESCGLQPLPAHVEAETAWRMMTRRDPYVNALRTTTAAFAAGVGGADAVVALPFTQALGLPDAQARRLARNAQLILIEEANLWRVADPAAGAGGYEALTDALAQKAWELFQEIERAGGLGASLASGAFASRVSEARAALVRDVARRKLPITGTSEYPNLAEAPGACSRSAADATSRRRPVPADAHGGSLRSPARSLRRRPRVQRRAPARVSRRAGRPCGRERAHRLCARAV